MNYRLRRLLSNNHKVIVELYETISETQSWITLTELSEGMSISRRTILRYIHKLETFIKEFNKNGKNILLFEFKKNLGVRIKIEEKENLVMFKNFIYEKDDNIQLLLHLLFNNNSTKKKYCTTYSVTESSLNMSIEKMNKFFSEFKLEISNTGLYVKGDESQIRIVCYSIVWILFESDSWPKPFINISKHKINQDIDLLESELQLPINYIKRRELSHLVAITIIRYRLGHVVRCKKEWSNYFPTSTASKLSNTITTIMMNHHVISNEEIKFLTINILTKSCIYKEIPLKKELLKFIQHDTMVYNATKLLMDRFNEEIRKIPIDLYDELFVFAYRSHLYAHIYYHINFDYNANYILDDIRKKFPSYPTSMAVFINRLHEKTGFTLFLEEEYLIQRYFMIETFIKPNILSGTPIKVLLETDIPEIYEKTIKRLLFNYFEYSYDLIFLTNNSLQKPDIVLTTIAPRTSKNNSVYFNYPLNNSDFTVINEKLNVIKKIL